MAASRDTKKMLADTLRSLMDNYSFDQITVTQICESCGINRKSFYYHFKDKYDVVNWIFDSEFNTTAIDPSLSGWVNLVSCCNYLYENRAFYKKALEITGQNSFTEHFRNTLYNRAKSDYRSTIPLENVSDFQINFFADAIVMAFHRWLRSKDCMTPDEFLEQLWECAQAISTIHMSSQK